MKTRILGIDENSLRRARRIILQGGVVAFPTETVYGLGANAFSDDAVKSVFKIKGRPQDNPLIVHVHKDYDLNTLVDYIPDYSKELYKTFLPGPLTMVYKSAGKVSKSVSCGLDTLAVRIPSHEGAQRFLKCVNLPIAAPSANLSKHVSPVCAEHVFDDLNGKIELVLDGGRCSGGIESTVLDCTGEVPAILRSGLVTREMIIKVVGACDIGGNGEKPLSPGMKYRHYAPNCKTAYFKESDIKLILSAYDNCDEKPYILCSDECAEKCGNRNVIRLGGTEKEMAANLYAKLREGEKKASFLIVAAPENHGGISEGLLNRLKKSCGVKD